MLYKLTEERSIDSSIPSSSSSSILAAGLWLRFGVMFYSALIFGGLGII
jgi:hypothetical protein